ncbi:MFS transporter [Rhizobium puerariae]|uniref:MFS transporter n=1 Tax=Rhizobium puerariae TaxID=1585791 RepID=A0ABV6AMF8_9HYPH
MNTQSRLFEKAIFAKVAWRILPLLFIVQLLGIVDRFNVGFAQLQMSADLGLSHAAYGLGAGLFFLGYFVFEVPSNMILAKVGARTWFTRILVTWGAATIAMAYVTNEGWFYFLRFLVGAAEAGFAPGVQLYFSKWFPNAYRGRANGLFLMSIPFGGLIGGPLSGFILEHMTGLGGHNGWQWIFLLEGAITVAFAPIVFLFLPSEPKHAKWLDAEERAVIDRSIIENGQGARAHSLRDLTQGHKVVLLSATYFLLLLGNYGISFWMPQIIKNSGISSASTIGWLAAIPALCTLVCMPLISRASDIGGRKWFIVGGALLASSGLIVTSSYPTNTVLALVGLAMTSVGVLGVVPTFWAYVARSYVGAAATVGFALINSIGNLAGFVAPYYMGVVADTTGSPAGGGYAIAIAGLCAALLAVLFFEGSQQPHHAVAGKN